VTNPDDPTTTTAADAPAGPPGGGTPPAGEGSGARRKARKPRSFWRELPFLIIIALVLALLIKTFLVQAFFIPSASMENTLMGGPPLGAGTAISADNPNRPNDRVLVNKLVYDFRDPHRGEIVVFKKPSYWHAESTVPQTTGIVHFLQDLEGAVGIPVNNTEDIIKRVIGVPGDVIRCSAAGGASNGTGTVSSTGGQELTVNGHRLTEDYLYPHSRECNSGTGFWTVKVPAGHLFVMGDHRDDSSDSRANWTSPPRGGPCTAAQNWCGAIPISDVIGRAFLVIWPPSDWRGLGVPATFDQPGLKASALPGPLLTPPALGLLGALPITWLRRRRLRRR
jgi:signal peptidase I